APWESNSPAIVGRPLPEVGVAGPGPDPLDWPTYPPPATSASDYPNAPPQRFLPAWDAVLTERFNLSHVSPPDGSELGGLLVADSGNDSPVGENSPDPWQFQAIPTGEVAEPRSGDSLVSGLSVLEIDPELLMEIAAAR